MMNIVVTDVNYRMSLAALRDLHDSGYKVHAVCFGDKPPPAFKLSFLAGRYLLPENANRQAEIAILASNLSAIVFPIGAKTLSALCASPEGVTALLPTEQALAAANDKSKVLELAKQHGIPIPYEFQTVELAAQHLPVVCKYHDGEALSLPALSRRFIAHDRAQLERKYSEFCQIAQQGGQRPPLLQRYVDGDGYGVSCLFDRQSRPISIICHRRTRQYPIDGGPSAACVSTWHDGMVSDAVALLKALSWTGVAMVEFKGNERNYALMEINPRIWGSFPLTRKAKSGFSQAYARAAQGEILPEVTAPNYEMGVKMGFALSNGAAAISYAKSGKIPSALHAAWQAITLPDGVFEAGDFAAGWAYIKDSISRR